MTGASIGSTICTEGWTATIRPPLAWSEAVKWSLLPAGTSIGDYQLDHTMPLELGGAPFALDNLQLVPIDRAHADDQVENSLRAKVCAGTLSLIDAQTQMLAEKTSPTPWSVAAG